MSVRRKKPVGGYGNNECSPESTRQVGAYDVVGRIRREKAGTASGLGEAVAAKDVTMR